MERTENDFKVQEFSRELDATLGGIHSEGLVTGQNLFRIWSFLLDFPGMDHFLSEPFYRLVKERLTQAEKKENVRGEMKEILTYPRKGYPPWVMVGTEGNILDHRLRGDAEKCSFVFRLVEGKIYAVCLSQPNLVQLAYDLYHPLRELKEMVPNIETCHITLVNSNIVAELGREQVEEFLQGYREIEVKITTGRVKTTFSEDWSRFGECAVVEISSSEIEEFLQAFNTKFGTKLKPSPHVTFAIRPRDRFRAIKMLAESRE